MTLGRKPLTIVEIDVDKCTRTFGTAPCTAALGSDTPRKCFNTFKTCADLPNYDRGSLTLRFAYNQSGLPKTGTFFAALVSVSDRPGEINLSGIDPKTTALGKRARVSISLKDFTYQDTLTDPYQAERVSGAAQFSGVGYDPLSQGTFFTRLLSRSPYYLGRSLRVLRGYEGDALGAMTVSHWVISEWSGPDAGGSVQITAKDVLDLVDGKRVMAPAPSRGSLLADLTEGGSSFTLTPSGIGSEYAASGRIAIGQEVMTFTRSGDVVTITERGVDGTDAESHSAGDTAQECLRYEDQTMPAIFTDLLTVHGPVDAAFVDTAAWEAEAVEWIGNRFTATIPKPTAISQLVGELCQHGAMIWWDAEAQEIKFKANRPKTPDEEFVMISDERNLIAGATDIERSEDQRISALYFYHGMIDPTDDVENGRNYSRVAVTVDVSASSANEHGEQRIKSIYSRWFGLAGNDAGASVVSERLLARYRDTPRLIQGLLDVKDEADVSLSDLIQISSRLLTDATGARETVTMQVNHVTRQGDRIMFKAEEYPIAVRFGFYMTDPQADYDTATDQEKAEGAFWFDEAETDFGDGTGPYLYF